LGTKPPPTIGSVGLPLPDARRRAATNASITSFIAAMAESDFRTVAAMTTPCSVKAQGSFLRPPREFDIAFCDIKLRSSSAVSWKA